MINLCRRAVFILLVLIAVLFDFRTDKIPNRLILAGILTALPLRLTLAAITENRYDIGQLFIGTFLLFLCLWTVYQMGGLGAGDCKLLLMTGIFLPVKSTIFITIGAFFIAAAAGVIKLLAGWLAHKEKLPRKIHFSWPVFCMALLHEAAVITGVFKT